MRRQSKQIRKSADGEGLTVSLADEEKEETAVDDRNISLSLQIEEEGLTKEEGR